MGLFEYFSSLFLSLCTMLTFFALTKVSDNPDVYGVGRGQKLSKNQIYAGQGQYPNIQSPRLQM